MMVTISLKSKKIYIVSTFADEDEFLKEHEQTKMWRTLSK
jgi:hypothetical protein